MKNLKLPSLVPSLAVQTLALSGLVASVMFAAKPAQAASLTYNWSFVGLSSTSGTFVADDATGLLSSIAGTVAGVPIFSLLGEDSYNGNDNLTPLNSNGISFKDRQGVSWNIGARSSIGDVNGDGITSNSGTDSGVVLGTFSYSPAPAAVPEPLTILGSITAAGFGVAFKRKKNSNKEE
jgi:hypothetical protein